MKFGFRLHPFGMFPDVPAIVETAQRGETLGYDFISLPEHTIFPREEERTMGKTWYETLTLATHLAALTKTIRYHTGAIVLTQHNPIYLAKQAATLDITSNGRIGLGLAGGWLEAEIGWLGGAVRNRGKAVEEYIAVMRKLWTEDPVTHAGERISFANASFHPKPVQKPLPIYVCGTARVSAPRAARIGDGWWPSSSPAAVFKECIDGLWRDMEALGRSRKGFSVINHMTLYELPEEIKEHTRTTGAEPEAGLGGDMARAREYVEYCEGIGVTHLLVLFSTRYPEFREQIEAFSEAVIRPRK